MSNLPINPNTNIRVLSEGEIKEAIDILTEELEYQKYWANDEQSIGSFLSDVDEELIKSLQDMIEIYKKQLPNNRSNMGMDKVKIEVGQVIIGGGMEFIITSISKQDDGLWCGAKMGDKNETKRWGKLTDDGYADGSWNSWGSVKESDKQKRSAENKEIIKEAFRKRTDKESEEDLLDLIDCMESDEAGDFNAALEIMKKQLSDNGRKEYEKRSNKDYRAIQDIKETVEVWESALEKAKAGDNKSKVPIHYMEQQLSYWKEQLRIEKNPKLKKQAQENAINKIKQNNKEKDNTVNKMSNEVTTKDKFFDMVKKDGINAGYRVVSTQIVKGMKGAILKLLESRGTDGGKLQMFSEMLDTEIGEAVISMMLGFGMNYAPVISEDPRVQKLAEEFRTNGMATAGNAVVGVAMESFLPVIQNALKALPAVEEEKTETKARVHAPSAPDTDDEEEEEEKEVVKGKTMKVA